MPTSTTVIMHADMDAFYASVEQRDHPEFRGKPLAVGGSSARGVVAAASYEARQFGVHSAMPSFEARRKCPDLVFVKGNMPLYNRESRRVFEIFKEFSPLVERLSLDEAFIDLTGTERLLGDPATAGENLRRRIHSELGLPVSVGIGPIKMVAKIASQVAKPDGLKWVKGCDVRSFLDPLPVSRIWGVGPVSAERLEAAGFYTLGDLARTSDTVLRGQLGDWGVEVAQLARGEDIRDVEPYRDAVSYGEEHTFAEDIADHTLLESMIRTHAESVARRLRRDGIRARTVVLKWKEGRRTAPGPRGYPLRSRRVTLPDPVDDGQAIAMAACGLLQRSGPTVPIRLIGVGCTNLEVATVSQVQLFSEGSTQRRKDLNQAIDRIEDRYGHGTLTRAGQKIVRRAGLSMQVKRGEKDQD